MKKSRRRVSWRRRLSPGEEAELRKWVKLSGLECVARVAAALTDASGERGQPYKFDTELLVRMAHLRRQSPGRSIYSVAEEVAKGAHPRRRRAELESLITKLQRDFKKHRHTWPKLAESAAEAFRQSDLPKPKPNEFRARARIVELLPSQIDVWDQVLAEAGAAGPAILGIVKKLGRSRGETLVTLATERLRVNPYTLKDPWWGGTIPRGFLDLIEPQLPELRELRRVK